MNIDNFALIISLAAYLLVLSLFASDETKKRAKLDKATDLKRRN